MKQNRLIFTFFSMVTLNFSHLEGLCFFGRVKYPFALIFHGALTEEKVIFFFQMKVRFDIKPIIYVSPVVVLGIMLIVKGVFVVDLNTIIHELLHFCFVGTVILADARM